MPYKYSTPPGEKCGLDNAFYGFAVFVPVMMNRFLRRFRYWFLVADEYGRDTRAHCETANKQQDGSGKVFHLFQIWFGGHGKKAANPVPFRAKSLN